MGVGNYHAIELVGEGSFGKVYKGRRKSTGQTVAMKFILKHGNSDKDMEDLRQEMEVLRHLKHENILEMLDAFESPEEFCVVPAFGQGEVFEILEDDKNLPEAQVQSIAKQLVSMFDEQEPAGARSFFTEIIASISDIKFAREGRYIKFARGGRYILSRDYMTLQLWDVNMEASPVATFEVHEYLRPKVRVPKVGSSHDEAPLFNDSAILQHLRPVLI